MRLSLVAASSALLLSVAACSSFQGTTTQGGTPSGAVSTGQGSATQMPQSANSLPSGSAVNAPITPRAGNVSTTKY